MASKPRDHTIVQGQTFAAGKSNLAKNFARHVMRWRAAWTPAFVCFDIRKLK
jgi:hypothetical protein